MDRRNVVLTGFMGTGKSTVGRLLADRLGRPFVDVDAVIESRAGTSIAELFRTRGEAAFRVLEAAACRELSEKHGLVIATGGGAMLDSGNRDVLSATGTVVCLTCEPDELMRRLEDITDRPLLDEVSEDRRSRIEALLNRRASTYEALSHHVDTTGLQPDEAADAVAQIIRSVARRLVVRHTHGAYDVQVALDELDALGASMRVAGLNDATAAFLVTNPVVDDLYGDRARRSLREAGFRPVTCVVPDGERHKRLATIESLYDRLVDAGIDRGSVVVGLGGGVTTDMAGFAAATILRGLRLVQVPTSLLAMVDASVGGKTGVNLPSGKNLVGAFWQPSLVVIDPRVLQTLPGAEVRSGVAEAIKHGVLGDETLFTELREHASDIDSWWSEAAVERISRAVRVKIGVVEADPLEAGQRVVLNLGHTAGHAIERETGYTIRHGEAVSIGLAIAARISQALGRAEPSLVATLEDVLSRWGLPTRCPNIRANRLIEAMSQDKKRTGDRLRWILPIAIGHVESTHDVPTDLVRRVLIDVGARSA